MVRKFDTNSGLREQLLRTESHNLLQTSKIKETMKSLAIFPGKFIPTIRLFTPAIFGHDIYECYKAGTRTF